MRSVVCVLLLVAFAYSQYQPVFYIDDFKTDSFQLTAQIPDNPTFPIVQAGSTETHTVIGGERDLLIQTSSGQIDLLIGAGVSDGYLTVTASSGASGSAKLTYDGTNTLNSFNPSGLFESGYSNFLQGNGFALSASIQSDVSTTVVFSVYSGTIHAVCQATIDIIGLPEYETYIVEYSQFSSGCEFWNVGAVEVEFMLPGNGDIHMQYLAVYGTELEQLSTQTHTRAPAPTTTASRYPSAAYTPSKTHTRAAPTTTASRYPSARYTPSQTPTRLASVSRTSTRTPSAMYTPSQTPTRLASASRTSTQRFVSNTPSRAVSISHTRTRAPTAAPPNCYSRLSPTSISAGTCMLLNSCTVTNKQSVYFQYNYSYENGRNSSGLSYYFIPSEQPITGCSTLSKYCYSVCGATANPVLGYVYLGDVNYHNFQLWAYYNNYNSNSADLFVNGTSVITYSN